MEFTIEHWPLDRLLPYAANARTHSDDQVAQIAGSIAAFGFNVPCLVNGRGVLIAGHGRLLAARQLELETVPVLRLEHLSETQARAYRIADNRIAENAGWDENLLRVELEQLREAEFGLDVTGFELDEVERLLEESNDGSTGKIDDDEAPEAPENPVSRKLHQHPGAMAYGQQVGLGMHIGAALEPARLLLDVELLAQDVGGLVEVGRCEVAGEGLDGAERETWSPGRRRRSSGCHRDSCADRRAETPASG